jgi:uncharacterized protein HemY
MEEILLPFIEEGEEDFELFEYLGTSHMKRKNWEDALVYFEKALSHKGSVINILNSIGYCWLELGAEARAIQALERSLEIDPDQEIIKEAVRKLKKEKRV